MRIQGQNKVWGLIFTSAGVCVLLTAMLTVSMPQTVRAGQADLSSATAKYPNIVGSALAFCDLCHTTVPSLNPYGTDYKNHGRNFDAFGLIESLDSDGDGATNIQEIRALTFPGNPASFPTPTPTATVTKTRTPTRTFTPTSTATQTPSKTSTATFTTTNTFTSTPTRTSTITPSETNTPTSTATNTPTATPTMGSDSANVDVDIAGNIVGNDINIPIQTGQRHGFAVDDGPAQVVSTNHVNIVTALRVIWKEPGFRTSYSEMMGLPAEQLSSEYWFPWYNNATTSMDQGFRIANLDNTTHTIKVFAGTTEIDSFSLDAGVSFRIGYSGDNGPIYITCDDCTGNQKIIVALRVIWKEPGFRFSYSEMMGLPIEQLSDEYWFPWYNNATTSMDQGFRIAVP